ncbi:uncharacterized protein PHACADRAFT_104685 [Phanerochaete carnosa HHB-10118-sp]|uniref:Carrier domain-containing protein n=1 Tax=Phanerochaete carnosa (strain HHB-10118-sp) TaxID=650164 RepID=K5VHP3_PHACS|nr:uncharacterized protein PHACADRAFT_104685 [Phanerochaete carnosa HHB-10118-sp]EKM50768.1 hypothetical protein PHACADRAFT_104685 [Phanerochaete carnosa HHB-10118-sp]
MVWSACPSADNLRLNISFDPTRFEPDTIQAILDNTVDVLAAIVSTPDHTVDNIPFSHALDQLVAAGIPVDPVPISSEPRPTLIQAFSDAVVAHHDLPALIDGDLTLTYHEVDILSSILSRRILEATKQQETHAFVSFCIPSGATAILTILAIVKSGAAYVPLDIRFPAERLESLVEDSGASLVITTSASPSFGFDRERVAHLDVTSFLDDRKSLVASSVHEERDGSVSPASPAESSNDAAYVLYTSGSTGKPKGVVIKQSSVVAFATNRDIFTWGPGYRIAQINNLAWDASVADIWCTLLLGATLVCFDRVDVLNAPALARRFQTARIDGYLLPTSLFRQFAAVCPDAFHRLTEIVTGGEALDYASVCRARAAAPSAVIRNAYGPTEACVMATIFNVFPGDDDVPHTGPVHIGRPLETSQVLVVDRYRRLVPPGVIGELIIGGEGIAEGYLNRPAETADAFVELHIDDLPGNTRFYRTVSSGDAVRWCDERLQFVGRMDVGQIKISGQRLELGEVEANILRTGLVADAGVSYHKPTDAGDSGLVAYVILGYEQTLEVDDHNSLRERLRAALPSYMVPDRLLSVDALPLLTSGKLDRRQLAAMAAKDASRDVHRAAEEDQDILPANDMEARLCAIFGRLLSSRAVSPLANFFQIGGHSLLATRLKSALESEFHVVIPLRTIFARSTPRQLAASIREGLTSAPPDQHASFPTKTILSHSGPSDPSDELSMDMTIPFDGTHYPLSFAQQRLWFLSKLAYYGSQNICYNTPYVLRLEGSLNIDALERTVQEVVSRHEILRTIFVEVNYAPATRVVDFCPRLEVVSVDPDTDEQSLRTLIGEYVRRPFSLDREPSVRATLFRLSRDHFHLLLCMHHIIVDGFSFDVIRQELAEIYVAFQAGKDHEVPPLPNQYKEFAQWQRSEDFERMVQPQLEYWTKQLKGNQAAGLPTDFPRPQHLSYEGKAYIAQFPQELFTRLGQICKQERVTMFMLLSAAFRMVQFQLTGQTDASFAFPIANRNRAETERLVGFFVNTQILRLKVRPGMTFLELIQQVRDLSMAAFEYQDLPFERIVSILNPTRDLNRNPLAQIILAYQTVKTAPFNIGDVRASNPRINMDLTRFDMEVHFFPGSDGQLAGQFVYSTDLFKEETVIDLTERLQKVLEQVVDNVHFAISPPRSSSTLRQPTPSDVAAYLHDYVPCEFPLDMPRCSGSVSPQRGTHSFILPPTICDVLRASSLGEEELPALYLTALSVLNHRYTRQGDITIGAFPCVSAYGR